MEEQELVRIDGVVLDPQPAPPYSFSKKEQDLDSGRNLLGVMERTILDHHVHTLSLKFPPMTKEKMRVLLNILDKPYLNVTAFDPFTNNMETYVMMHGDLTANLNIYTKDRTLYDEYTVELVEY